MKKDITKIVHKMLMQYRKEKILPPMYLQCFEQETLIRLKKEFKTPFKLIQLIGENSWGESSTNYQKLKTRQGLEKVKSYADGIGPHISQIVERNNKGEFIASEMLKNAKDLKLLVHTYTVRKDQLPPKIKNISSLLNILTKKLNVDGVFTDHPDLVSLFLNKKN